MILIITVKMYIDSAKDFADTDKTFKDIFSDIEKEKLYYVDNEAYCIKKIDVNYNTKSEILDDVL